ncbi:metallophosphoesterase [Pseudactinotalea sp. Z1732]|uniref:metallophosphoesterase family protein n=1 Tax=Pseudactinotalea sp. Z1732 TaxID=3413026 RepID=UPI003C7A9BAB
MTDQTNEPRHDGDRTADRPGTEAQAGERRFAWWHGLRPLTRRAIRVGTAVLMALLVSIGFAVSTASYTGSLGPHVAEYSTRLNGEIRVDMGPLGSLVIASPLPANLGVNVLVREIPDQLTSDDADPIAGLMADLNSYNQFLANPQATIDDAARGLIGDVVGRAVVTLSVLLMAIALSRLVAHGVLREALKSAWRQPGVPFVAPTLAVVLVILPLTDLTRSFGLEGRSSPVLAGTALEDARITGRLATIVDYYGGMVVRAVEDNTSFYADVESNLIAAYEANPAALAPPVRPAPLVEDEDGDVEDTDSGQDAGGAGDTNGAEGTDGGEATDDGEATDGGATDDGDAPEAEGIQGADGTDDGGTGGADTTDPGDLGDAVRLDEDEVGAPGDGDAESAQPDRAQSLAFTDPDAEYATFLMVADLHCNVGMAPVIGTAATLGEVDAILNAGDTVMSGTSVESFCVNAFADEIPSGLPVIVADGNHDSVLTAEQERARGWTVLDGDVVEVAAVRILGDTDPTLTEIGTGTRPERDETVVEMGERLRAQACELQEEESGADILLVHSPHAGRQALDAGCVPMNLSGHMHTQRGPLQLGWGVQYVSGSTAGATLGRPTVGPLQGTAAMTMIRWNLTEGIPDHYRLIHAEPDASVSLGPWLNFPALPTEHVDPTAPEPEPEPEIPDGVEEPEDVEEGDPSAPDQNLPEDDEAIREES